MHPDLFKIGPLTVHTYGVAMAASFLVAFWLSARRSARERLDPEMLLDSFLPLFIGAIIGARLLYILTDLQSFMSDPLSILKIWQGGLVFYGGFLGGMVGVLIFVKRRGVSFWQVMDLMAPYAGLGYAIHRTFGCFLGNGCCYGAPTTLPWGILYPADHITRHLFGMEHVHPTQIYESLSGLIIMAAIMIYRRRPHRIGQPSGIFLIIYSIMRFGIEFLRGDEIRGFWGPLSTSQWISIVMFITGIVLLFIRKTPVLEPLDAQGAEEFVRQLYDEEKKEEEPSSPPDKPAGNSEHPPTP